jgi:hypothetical protein
MDSAVVYTTFSELVDRADVIIIGKATAKKGVVNTARDLNDNTMPDSTFYSIGQIYEVQVDSYLKGNGPGLIYVIQNQGHISSAAQGISNDEIEQAQELSNHIPLTINEQYMMFLSSPDPDYSYNDFPIDDYYFGGGHPWRFEITEAGCVQPIDEEGESLYLYFPSQPLDEFLRFINNPGAFPTLPYPAPISPSRCPTESITTYP